MKKTVVITGVSSGIGQAMMKKFLGEGHIVIGTVKSHSLFPFKWVKNAHSVEMDLISRESIRSAVSGIKKISSNIDLLINNAGIYEELRIEVDDDLLRKTLQVNLIGLIDFTEQVIPVIRKDGRIISVSTGMGTFAGYEGTTAPEYQIAKVGVNKYAQILGERLGGKITVAAVDPGWVKTKIGGRSAPGVPEDSANDIYDLAFANIETGKLWQHGKLMPW